MKTNVLPSFDLAGARTRPQMGSLDTRSARLLPALAVAALCWATAPQVHAQQYWDPTGSGGTALGGTGTWWGGPNWWDGSADSWFNDSGVIFAGTNGTVTLDDTSINCGNGPGMVFLVDGYIINYNGKHINFHDPSPDVYVTNGATARFVGNSGGTGGTIRKTGAGTLVIGDGTSQANGYAGVGDYVEGTVVLNNDPAGAGSTSWYVNLRGATVAGTGSADALVEVHNGGTISPGAPPRGTGKLTWNGDVHETAASASLEFDLGGLSAGAASGGYDVLDVKGTATLAAGSIVTVRLGTGFTPALGNSFDVVTATSILIEGGALTNLVFNFPTLPGSLGWTNAIVNTTAGQALRLTVVNLGGSEVTVPTPVAYLNFDNTLTDMTGNGNDGSFLGTAAFSADVPGPVGGPASAELADGSALVDFATAATFNLNTGNPYTITLWFKAGDASGWPTLYAKKSPNGDGSLGYHNTQLMIWGGGGANLGHLHMDVSWVGGIDSRSAVADGQWHHAAVVYSGSAYQLYLDGAVDATGSIAGANEGDTDNTPWTFQLGGGSAHNIDEFGYWNSALSLAQVAKVMAAGPIPRPTLQVSFSGNQITVSGNLTGFRIQQSSSLENPAGWTDVAGGTAASVTLARQAGPVYFRAVK